MDVHFQSNRRRTRSKGETFAGFRDRLATAATEMRQLAQQLFESQAQAQALRLSVLTTLPIPEAYCLVTTHGLGFAKTVEKLIWSGYSVQQALSYAERGIGAEMLAVSQRSIMLVFQAFCQPTACRGCQHYYGRSDGGNQLICAMHPYGPETDACEDWEAIVHHL